MAGPLFELRDVRYAYHGKYPALRGVSLSIERGTRVALVGANGTGKSTLLAMLDALIFPDGGAVLAMGKELTAELFEDAGFSLEFRRRVGFVFQNPEVQLFCPTVEEDIAFGPLQLGAPVPEIRARLERLSSVFKLSDILGRAPHQLSVGEKRKVTLASVLAIEPEILLLDEPTAGLDPQTVRDIIAVLLAEHGAGKTIVFATHDLHLVEEFADVVHVMGPEKNLIRSAAPGDILLDQDFLEMNNLVHIHAHRHADMLHIHAHRHSRRGA